jgi:hypothetical protein
MIPSRFSASSNDINIPVDDRSECLLITRTNLFGSRAKPQQNWPDDLDEPPRALRKQERRP